MIHARDDYNRIQDPEGKIAEDEPVFLIRAKDINAPAAIREYAQLAKVSGAADDLLEACEAHAVLSEQWQRNNAEIVHTPDL